MGWVMMDERELHRIGVLSEIQLGSRTIASGAALLGLTFYAAAKCVMLASSFSYRGIESCLFSSEIR